MEGSKLQPWWCCYFVTFAFTTSICSSLTSQLICGAYTDPGVPNEVVAALNATFTCSREVQAPSMISMVIMKEEICTELYGPAEYRNGTLISKFQIPVQSELTGNETVCCKFAQYDEQDLSVRHRELYNCTLVLPRKSTSFTTESTALESSNYYFVVLAIILVLIMVILCVMCVLLFWRHNRKNSSAKPDGSDDYRKSGIVHSEATHTSEDCVPDDGISAKADCLFVGVRYCGNYKKQLANTCDDIQSECSDVVEDDKNGCQEEKEVLSCSQNSVGPEDMKKQVCEKGDVNDDSLTWFSFSRQNLCLKDLTKGAAVKPLTGFGEEELEEGITQLEEASMVTSLAYIYLKQTENVGERETAEFFMDLMRTGKRAIIDSRLTICITKFDTNYKSSKLNKTGSVTVEMVKVRIVESMQDSTIISSEMIIAICGECALTGGKLANCLITDPKGGRGGQYNEAVSVLHKYPHLSLPGGQGQSCDDAIHSLYPPVDLLQKVENISGVTDLKTRRIRYVVGSERVNVWATKILAQLPTNMLFYFEEMFEDSTAEKESDYEDAIQSLLESLDRIRDTFREICKEFKESFAHDVEGEEVDDDSCEDENLLSSPYRSIDLNDKEEQLTKGDEDEEFLSCSVGLNHMEGQATGPANVGEDVDYDFLEDANLFSSSNKSVGLNDKEDQLTKGGEYGCADPLDDLLLPLSYLNLCLNGIGGEYGYVDFLEELMFSRLHNLCQKIKEEQLTEGDQDVLSCSVGLNHMEGQATGPANMVEDDKNGYQEDEESLSCYEDGLEDVKGEGSKDEDDEFLSCDVGLNSMRKQTKTSDNEVVCARDFCAREVEKIYQKICDTLERMQGNYERTCATVDMSFDGLYGSIFRCIPQPMTMSLDGSILLKMFTKPKAVTKNFGCVLKTNFQNLDTEPRPITTSLVGVYGGDYPNLMTRLQGSIYRNSFLNMLAKPNVIDICWDDICGSSCMNLVTRPQALAKNIRCVFTSISQNLGTELKWSLNRSRFWKMFPKAKVIAVCLGESTYLNLMTRPQALNKIFEYLYKIIKNLDTEPKPMTKSLGSQYRSNFLNMFPKPRNLAFERDSFKTHLRWTSNLQHDFIKRREIFDSISRAIERSIFNWRFSDYSTYTDMMLEEALVEMDSSTEQQILAMFAAMIVAYTKLQENFKEHSTVEAIMIL